MLADFYFVRTHKSHHVNPAHTTRISSDREEVILSDGRGVEISRRKKDEVLMPLGARK